jgi:hypothetical protein
MKTLLLDRSTWDLVLDARGNLAVADDPYSITQDVASAVRLFRGELWYDTTKGVPHFEEILGKQPSLAVMKAVIQAAAVTVPEVVAATVYISGVVKREVTGQIQVTDTSGRTSVISGGLKAPTPT